MNYILPIMVTAQVRRTYFRLKLLILLALTCVSPGSLSGNR